MSEIIEFHDGNAAQVIESRNKASQAALTSRIERKLRRSDDVTVIIKAAEDAVLTRVAAQFRFQGFEVSYNPDRRALSVKLEEK